MTAERQRFFDEMFEPDGAARATYSQVAAWVERHGHEKLSTFNQQALAVFFRKGVTFTVYSDASNIERVIPFDIIPRIIPQREWQMLENLRKLEPGIALGLLAEAPADERLIHWYQRINGFSWHPDFRVLTRQQVDSLHDLGARVFPYAVDGRIDSLGMLAMGVDGLIVDDPRQMTARQP